MTNPGIGSIQTSLDDANEPEDRFCARPPISMHKKPSPLFSHGGQLFRQI